MLRQSRAQTTLALNTLSAAAQQSQAASRQGTRRGRMRSLRGAAAGRSWATRAPDDWLRWPRACLTRVRIWYSSNRVGSQAFALAG